MVGAPKGAGGGRRTHRFADAVIKAAWQDAGFSMNLVRGASVHFHEIDSVRTHRRGRMSFVDDLQSVLIVKKPGSKAATKFLERIALWLRAQGIRVLVQDAVHAEELSEGARAAAEPLGDRAGEVGMCVTLGGDGTVLFAGTLFPPEAPMPPFVSFAMGTLGFLTPYDVRDFKQALARVIEARGGHALPAALQREERPLDEILGQGHSECEVTYSEEEGPTASSCDERDAPGRPPARVPVPPPAGDAVCPLPGPGDPDGGGWAVAVALGQGEDPLRSLSPSLLQRTTPCTLRSRLVCELWHEGELLESSYVLNETVVDRGLAMHALEVELWVDGSHVTNVRADSVILATPSGSTAYSMSAGGPVVSPSVPCILVTPVAPHSLSFRPIVVPDTSVLDLRVPCRSRAKPRAYFDGRKRIRMPQGSYIRCYSAAFPLCMLTPGAMDQDWYRGITEKLGWNHQIRVHKSSLDSLNGSLEEDVDDDLQGGSRGREDEEGDAEDGESE